MEVLVKDLLLTVYSFNGIRKEEYEKYINKLNSSTDYTSTARGIIANLAPLAYICGEISEDKLIDIVKMFRVHHMYQIWPLLPFKFKKHPQIIERLICNEHWNLPTQQLHIDGCPPSIMNCDRCRNNKDEAENFSKKKLW